MIIVPSPVVVQLYVKLPIEEFVPLRFITLLSHVIIVSIPAFAFGKMVSAVIITTATLEHQF